MIRLNEHPDILNELNAILCNERIKHNAHSKCSSVHYPDTW